MTTIAAFIAAFWLISLLIFGVMAVWSVFPDPAADGQWGEDSHRVGVGAGSGAHETASTPSSVPTVGVHANAHE